MAHVGDVRMNITEGRGFFVFALARSISTVVRKVSNKKIKKFTTRLEDDASSPA